MRLPPNTHAQEEKQEEKSKTVERHRLTVKLRVGFVGTDQRKEMTVGRMTIALRRQRSHFLREPHCSDEFERPRL